MGICVKVDKGLLHLLRCLDRVRQLENEQLIGMPKRIGQALKLSRVSLCVTNIIIVGYKLLVVIGMLMLELLAWVITFYTKQQTNRTKSTKR